jgi:TolA-binding protein
MKCFFLFISLVFSTVLNSLSWALPQPTAISKRELDLKAELTGHDLKKMNDDQLYSEILLQYQRNDGLAMRGAVEFLLKKFPNSSHADGALYLMGQACLEKKQFAEGLQFFQRLLRDYPMGHKAVSAEFAKGIAYRNMNIGPLARQAFVKVKGKYPGSPESYRAESELKLLMRK